MIYVDEPRTMNPRFVDWSHMWSSLIDTDYEAALIELHDMAHAIGLKDEYLQTSQGINGLFPHFDISPAKRAKALKLGARPMSLRQWISLRRS